MAKKTIEQLTAAIERWQSRLRRSVNAINRLEAQRKRAMKAAAKPPKLRARAASLAETIMKEIAAPPAPKPVPEIDTAIPAFLQRAAKSDKDAAAADEIRQQQADAKKAKAAARASRKAADKSGATRKMPLSGKAALDAIRNG